VKRFLILWPVLFSAVFFYSCGNPLLGLGENGQGDDGSTSTPSGTTAEDVPKNVTPIYIDTNDQLKDLLAGSSENYPNYGFYILRGDGVPDRTFTVTKVAYPADTSFTGTLTGWFKDDETGVLLTKVVLAFGQCLFTVMDGATVSWLKFETDSPVSTLVPSSATPIMGNPDAQYAGIVAAYANNTTFQNVSVSGTVNVKNPTLLLSTTSVYVGGIVGKAAGNTGFEDCNVGANVSAESIPSTGSLHVYVGGIAGSLNGPVKNSTVLNTSSNYSQPITVTVSGGSGNEMCHAGGIAGIFESGVTVESTPVSATVNATGSGTDIYAGGYAGEAAGTGTMSVYGLNENNQKIPVNVTTLAITASTNGTGSIYAGGIVGKTVIPIDFGRLSGQITVTASSSGTAYSGGIAGYSDANATISNSSVSGSGVSAGFTLSGSTATVTAKKAYAGGIAGYADGAITKSYANITSYSFTPDSEDRAGIDARVSQSDGIAAAGGIAGNTDAAISECYAVVTVKARAGNTSSTSPTTPYGAIAGGIAGIGGASVSNTFALAQLDARVPENTNNVPVYAGGIVGYLSSNYSVQTSYAAGSVMAHTFTSGGTVYAGGIAGYVASTSGSVVEKCVALQKYIGSDGPMFRVIGGMASTPALTDNRAYVEMKKYSGGSKIIDGTNNVAAGKGGADISAAEAKTFTTYTGTPLSWNGTVWETSTYYPTLKKTPASTVSVPTWAQIP
jgi:hypothetical protein